MMAWKKVKLAAAGALVAVGFAFTAAAFSPKAPNHRILAIRQAADTIGHNMPDDRRWVRSLPNGVTIEVVRVSSIPAGADTWWRPDGTPLHPAPGRPDRANGLGPQAHTEVYCRSPDRNSRGSQSGLVDRRGP